MIFILSIHKTLNSFLILSTVKDVLDEIKASIPEVKRAHQEISQRGSKRRRSKRSQDRDKPSKITDTYIFDPDTTILEQLQISLNTLCSVIDGINPENDFIKLDTPKTRSVVQDLIEFKKIIHKIVDEVGDTEGPKEIEFLRNADKRIRDVCKSLLRDLSYTVNGLTMKIHHKLNKVRQKLNRRLCLLKNSESADRQIFKSLDENNSFLQSCDNILNVTFNPSQRSMKPNKKKTISGYKAHSKTAKTTFHKVPASESEDDSYPKDSSSDSSVPDLAYNPGSDEVWDKEESPRRVGANSKGKSGKIPLRNTYNRRKMKNSKSGRDRSFKKLMMEVLVPRESCPLAQEHWLAAESECKERQRLETETLKQKPLYSTILKSTKERELDENTPAVERRNQESRVETKHDVTPAESGMDVETVKSLKEQRNANIRKPLEKHSGVAEGPENEEKRRRKGKKRSSDSAKSSDGVKDGKKSGETKESTNSRKRRNDEVKRQKKLKNIDERLDKTFKKNSQLAADWQLQR